MTDLKPCPFCGSPAEWSRGELGNGDPWHYISCSECECCGPHVAGFEKSKIDPSVEIELATERWNTRKDTAQEEINGLRVQCDSVIAAGIGYQNEIDRLNGLLARAETALEYCAENTYRIGGETGNQACEAEVKRLCREQHACACEVLRAIRDRDRSFKAYKIEVRKYWNGERDTHP